MKHPAQIISKLALISILAAALMVSAAGVVCPQDRITLNYADSLVGKVVMGEQLREAMGNVSLTHGDVKISCNRVVQYFEQNKAELFGSVKVVKDTMTILAPSGIYYGTEAKVVCPSGATLNDSKATLTADFGSYLFNQDLAYFRGNVKIVDSKSYTITSDELNYYRSVSKSYANGNVKIVTDSAVIYSDSLVYEKLIGVSSAAGNVKIESDSTVINSDKLTYYESERKSIAEQNVKINFLNKNSVIYGNYAENYERTDHSFISGNCRLIQTEKEEDTVFIYSENMKSYRKLPEYYIATDSVKMMRSDFSSSSQTGYYFKDTAGPGGIVTLSGEPAVWKENMQITGDSIIANFGEDIDDIFVNKSAFAVQFNEKYSDRYDQISGMTMFMKFRNDEAEFVQVDTGASSIYFVYDNGEPNGVNKSEGERIILYFKDNDVDKVKITGLPKGTYIPENLADPAGLRLLGFKIRKDKPVKR